MLASCHILSRRKCSTVWFVTTRTWPSDDLAKMLMGEEDTQHHSLLQSAPFIFGCLSKALADKALTRQDVSNALAQASLQPFLAQLTGQQLAWLQRHMQLISQFTAQVTMASRLAVIHAHFHTHCIHAHFIHAHFIHSQFIHAQFHAHAYPCCCLANPQCQGCELHWYVGLTVTAVTWVPGVFAWWVLYQSILESCLCWS